MGTKLNKPKPSHSMLSDLECIDEEAERLLAMTKQRLSVPHDVEAPNDDITDHPGPEAICNYLSNKDCPEADLYDDCVISNEDNVIKSEHTVGEPINLDRISQLNIDEDEDFELQAMFYLPKSGSASLPSPAKLRPGRDESLKVILSNVAELLSRSPPSLTEDLEADVAAPSLPPSLQRPHQPFQVSFTLNVDDDDDDDDDEVIMSDADNASLRADSDEPSVGKRNSQIYHDWPCLEQQQSPSRGRIAAESPTWDEVFGEEEVHSNHEKRDVDIFKEEWVIEEMKSKNDSMTEEEASCWDDVRNEEIPGMTDGGVKEDPQMDNSMDLFGDDEAFLQMTIPDISTPGVTPRTSPSAGDIAYGTKKILHMHTPTNPCSITHTAESTHRLTAAAHTEDLALTKPITHTPHATLKPQEMNAQTTAETEHNTHNAATNKHVPADSVTAHKSLSVQHSSKSFDSSHDYFSVNFDLGYSLEDSEEEREEDDVPAPSTLTSPLPKKWAVADSSTPYNSFHRARMPLLSSESMLSTPQMLSEHRRRKTSSLLASPLTSKGGAHLSPITSPGARWTISPGPARPRTPSLLSSLKRRRLDGHMTETEMVPDVENSRRQGSVSAADSPPRPGWFTLQEI